MSVKKVKSLMKRHIKTENESKEISEGAVLLNDNQDPLGGGIVEEGEKLNRAIMSTELSETQAKCHDFICEKVNEIDYGQEEATVVLASILASIF